MRRKCVSEGTPLATPFLRPVSTLCASQPRRTGSPPDRPAPWNPCPARFPAGGVSPPAPAGAPPQRIGPACRSPGAAGPAPPGNCGTRFRERSRSRGSHRTTQASSGSSRGTQRRASRQNRNIVSKSRQSITTEPILIVPSAPGVSGAFFFLSPRRGSAPRCDLVARTTTHF